jgi:hypothetical protein
LQHLYNERGKVAGASLASFTIHLWPTVDGMFQSRFSRASLGGEAATLIILAQSIPFVYPLSQNYTQKLIAPSQNQSLDKQVCADMTGGQNHLI